MPKRRALLRQPGAPLEASALIAELDDISSGGELAQMIWSTSGCPMKVQGLEFLDTLRYAPGAQPVAARGSRRQRHPSA